MTGRLHALRTPLLIPALIVLLCILAPLQSAAQAAQTQSPNPVSQLPDAPKPQTLVRSKAKPAPCRVLPDAEWAGTAAGTMAAAEGTGLAGVEPVKSDTKARPAASSPAAQAEPPPCPPQPLINWFARFLNGPQVKPLTAKEKARLAIRNVLDPFNAITILGQSAIAIGSNSDSPYGPGMPGFARNVGVSYTQDITGEFFGTFLIPSIVHQDPHYHRMPNASYIRRVRHAIVQVVWTQGDNGKGMLNYANLVGFAIDDEISNLYVPGEQTDLPASAARYSIGLATAPADNFITEFLPDVARRIHVRIVLVQRIIDQVARTENGGTQ